MKKLLFIIPLFILTLSLFGCSAGSPYSKGEKMKEPSYYRTDSEIAPIAPSDIEGFDSTIQSGQLTSKAWSDNENFDYWLSLITDKSNAQEDHYLKSIYEELIRNQINFKATVMLKAHLKSGEQVLENATVKAVLNSEVLFTAKSDAFGNAYLFFHDSNVEGMKLVIEYNGQIFEEEVNAIPTDYTVNINLDECVIAEKAKKLDLCLVLDTTGSMSDELEYLKVELKSVLQRIAEDIDFDINLGLIFYRDEGDAYTVKTYGFNNVLEEQYAALGKEHATGGGDFPELVDQALYAATEETTFQWRNDATKLLIHVLDAPLHSNAKNYRTFTSAVNKLAEKGVRIIPVICSAGGGGQLLEFTMRYAALYTGGTYTYLTDDSGIGGSHDEPAVEDGITVEYLNNMLCRLIKEYCTGEKIEPQSIYGKDPNTDPVEKDEYRVEFNTHGGTEANTQLVKKGGLVEKPADPVKEGYSFAFWYTIDSEGEVLEYDFETPVESDITLHAFWTNTTPAE